MVFLVVFVHVDNGLVVLGSFGCAQDKLFDPFAIGVVDKSSDRCYLPFAFRRAINSLI